MLSEILSDEGKKNKRKLVICELFVILDSMLPILEKGYYKEIKDIIQNAIKKINKEKENSKIYELDIQIKNARKLLVEGIVTAKMAIVFYKSANNLQYQQKVDDLIFKTNYILEKRMGNKLFSEIFVWKKDYIELGETENLFQIIVFEPIIEKQFLKIRQK